MVVLGSQIEESGAGRSRRAAARTDFLIALALAGLVLDVVLAYGLLWPLDHGRHSGVVAGYQPLATVFGTDDEGLVRFVAVVLAAYLVYAAAVFLARRVAGRGAFGLVLAGTVVLSVTLLPTNPAGSHDIYHNIADARTFWVHGDNPAATPPSAHPDDPMYPYVVAWPDTPSTYGPVWYVISGAPLPFAGTGLWANVLGQKVLTVAFLVAATALVMLITGRIRPGSAIAAGVFVGWNPLLVFETAGNAHNDIVMVAFALGAFYALVRRWWALAFPLLALAVAVKYVVILLAPVFLLWMLMRRDIPFKQVALSVLLGTLLGAAMAVPFLAGGGFFDTLRGEGSRHLSSTGTFLISVFMQQMDMGQGQSVRAMERTLWAVFIAGYAALLLRTRRDQSYASLAATSAWVMALFLVTVKWWFWPWYLAWLVPLAALTPRRGEALFAVVFSLTSMLLYAAYFWNIYDEWHHQQRLVFATVFAVPLALASLLVLKRIGARLSASMTAVRRRAVAAEE